MQKGAGLESYPIPRFPRQDEQFDALKLQVKHFKSHIQPIINKTSGTFISTKIKSINTRQTRISLILAV